MRSAVKLLSILLMLAVSACAIAEVAKTPSPPLTLGPAPTIMTKGSCEVTPELEAWAQAAYYQTTDFVRTFNAASSKARGEVYNDVLQLQDLRTNMIARPTPDCALDTQIVLADGMDKAIRALQSYGNGDLKDLGSLLPDITSRLQLAVDMGKQAVQPASEAVSYIQNHALKDCPRYNHAYQRWWTCGRMSSS